MASCAATIAFSCAISLLSVGIRIRLADADAEASSEMPRAQATAMPSRRPWNMNFLQLTIAKALFAAGAATTVRLPQPPLLGRLRVTRRDRRPNPLQGEWRVAKLAVALQHSRVGPHVTALERRAAEAAQNPA